MSESFRNSDRLEELVVARDLTPPDTMNRARLVQAETGEPLHSVLTRLGFVTEQALAQALSEQTGLRIVGPSDYPVAPIAVDCISSRFLRDIKAVPLRESPEGLEVAFVNPLDPFPETAIAFALQRNVKPVVARASDLEAALDRLYGTFAPPESAGDTGGAGEDDLERLKDLASDAPVVRAVNSLLTRAVEAQASDIHLEPSEDSLKVRFRIDGALRDEDSIPSHLRAAFVSRIKVISGLDIAERRLPQDGRLRHAVRGQEIDFRVATSPTIHGEGVVLRILDRSNMVLEFAALGFDAETADKFDRGLHRPHGIILVTGPTGSGKTTTLYASLAVLNTADRKILTIEDPIEYRLAGTNQTQVKPQIGLTFAAALRSFLRQDPDVMMVGEIRDLETAQVAIQSALTGHLILSTLHTNSAASAVTRLIDMGVEPFLITSTLNAVLAQRLVRRLCQDCRVSYQPLPESLAALGISLPAGVTHLYKECGCRSCRGTGYRGRLALLELLVVDDEIAKLILSRAEAREIQRVAGLSGMRGMLADGVNKAAAGLTTLEEILRVTREG